MFVIALPVLAVGVLFGRKLRFLTVPLALVGAGYFALESLDRPPPPDESLTPADIEKIYAALLSRVKSGGPNHLHSRRLFHYAPPFAKAAGANLDVVQAAALLHDSTKEDGSGEPKERFCTHGDQGAAYTQQVLEGLGKSKGLALATSQAVSEHMGPCGFNWSFFSKRFMSKFCDRKYDKPKSAEARVLYDIDMLDLMTVDGVVKVVELRQTNPEFEKEPLKDSAISGADSAWKSVVDARQTLLTDAAGACGDKLTLHTQQFVDGVDFERVKDVDAFKRAAAEYLAARPLPDCLPKVTALDGSPSP
jgi:hypothetical protein